MLDRINDSWKVAELEPLLHPDIVMTLPGFAGRVERRAALLVGFEDHCRHAITRRHQESRARLKGPGGGVGKRAP